MMQFGSYPQRKYNFNFEKFFSQFPGFNAPESSQPLPSPSSRTFNTYGQDAEAFGSAIGKSIGQRIQQAFSQQDPTYDIQFTPPASSGSSSSSPYSSPPSASTPYASMSPSTSSSYPSSSYGSSIPSSYPTTSWPSTHPPEDLPTVQQAFQAQQRSYGSTPASFSSHSQVNSNGFGGMPGLLPPPQNADCPWCTQNGGYRGKRIPNEKEQDKKKNGKV